MADLRDSVIKPALPVPVTRVAAVLPVGRDAATTGAVDQKRAPEPSPVAATTGGSLRPAYAQLVIDPETHDTVLRVHDAATNAIISESPSPEVQAMSRALKAYSDTLARHQAALRVAAGT
jgi:hypothetical protein